MFYVLKYIRDISGDKKFKSDYGDIKILRYLDMIIRGFRFF